MSMKSCWFDSAEIVKRMDAATRRVLTRFGAYVRKVAVNSIVAPNRAKGIVRQNRIAINGNAKFYTTVSSQPGNPPFDQGGPLKKFIFYGWEKSTGTFSVGGSMLIGPSKLSGRVSQTALQALEYGGPSQTFEYVYPSGGQRRYKKYRQVNIEARPFMGPAFERSKQQLPELWQDCLHRLG